MYKVIKRHSVQHPLLRNYIKFFWELHIDNAEINHRIIPQRNINLRFNLNDIPHYAVFDGKEQILNDVNFSGLQDKYLNTRLKMNGGIHVLGISFTISKTWKN